LAENLEILPHRLALSIVIPVYNGATNIADLVHALENLSIAGGHEIVLVNDGSGDDSLAVCHALFDQARVPMTIVSLARNYGEHNAVMAGLRYASGAHVITMDDDLQNPPYEVQRLLAFAQRNGKEVVYTYFYDKRHAVWRNMASRFANRVADFVLDKPRGLYLSSFRCMTAFVAREIIRYEGPFPYVDGLILQVTHDIDRLPVSHLPRATGSSNYTMRRLLRLWMNMFCNFSVMPLRISTVTGFALSALGAVGVAMAVGEALFFVSASRLGLSNGGGAVALRRTALDPRYHWGIPWPTLSHRQPKASICGKRSAAYRAPRSRREQVTELAP